MRVRVTASYIESRGTGKYRVGSMDLLMNLRVRSFYFFFFNDTATTEIYTLSLHDALPISVAVPLFHLMKPPTNQPSGLVAKALDRKSTRLNSSHGYISYAVFCLKKKKNTTSSCSV